MSQSEGFNDQRSTRPSPEVPVPSASRVDDAIDLERLGTYLAEQLGHAPDRLTLDGFAQSGSSNITAFLNVDGAEWVLRRPPTGDVLPSAHDMIREYRFVSALQSSLVPVARTILACEDGSVLGAPFYLAERLRGVVLQDGIPEAFRDPHVVAAVADLAVDTLAAIHGVTWKTLDVPYRPGNYLQRQIRRWTGQLELTPTASRLSGLDRVTRWIIENLPESGGSTIVHGDYGLHNMILQAPPGVRIMAVLDWEMATIGDPLADLAWFLSGWGQSQEDEGVRNPANVIATWPGAPDRFALQRRYEMATGRKIENWNFYEVFTLWKGTIITEGLYSAYVSGTAANQAVVRFETQVPEQVERLLGLISVQGTC